MREAGYVSLRGNSHYPIFGGDLISSDGVRVGEDEYLALANEYLVDFSPSKFCRLSRESFAVGSLARFNNNYESLPPRTKEGADVLGLTPAARSMHFLLGALIYPQSDLKCDRAVNLRALRQNARNTAHHRNWLPSQPKSGQRRWIFRQSTPGSRPGSGGFRDRAG